MSTAARKRVSFGSHKSMVETLIIDISDDFLPSAEERSFYEYNLFNLRHSKSSTAAELSTAGIHHRPHSSAMKPIHKRSGSGGTIDIDNPFAINGELRRKADFILRHSRISRADLQIVDPDSIPRPGHTLEQDLPRTVEETSSRHQEVPSTNDNKTEDKATFEKPTVNGETAQENNSSEMVEADPTSYTSGTPNRSNRSEDVPEIVENRTLPELNNDSKIQSNCDVQFTQDTVCTRKTNPVVVVVVDSVVIATSPEYQQAEQIKLSAGKCTCCNVQ